MRMLSHYLIKINVVKNCEWVDFMEMLPYLVISELWRQRCKRIRAYYCRQVQTILPAPFFPWLPCPRCPWRLVYYYSRPKMCITGPKVCNGQYQNVSQLHSLFLEKRWIDQEGKRREKKKQAILLSCLE
jgi:hypothetical protein